MISWFFLEKTFWRTIFIRKCHGFWEKLSYESKDMFGNCFFPLFFVFFKKKILFLRLKNLFGNSKWVENKNCFQNSICEGNWKHAKSCFQFLIFKSQWKYASILLFKRLPLFGILIFLIQKYPYTPIFMQR